MFDFLLNFNWEIALSNLLLISMAFILSLPIAWDREVEERSAGLRTFPLVAVGSCGFILLIRTSFGFEPDSMARVVTGVITGIGFIGGGAIIKEGASVRGTATAASIWTTGAIGTAIAFHRIEIAVVLSALTFFALRILKPLKKNKLDTNELPNND